MLRATAAAVAAAAIEISRARKSKIAFMPVLQAF
jgi:hypothetical protein